MKMSSHNIYDSIDLKNNYVCFSLIPVEYFNPFDFILQRSPTESGWIEGSKVYNLGWLVWHTDDAPLRFAILIPCVAATFDTVQDVATIPHKIQSTLLKY